MAVMIFQKSLKKTDVASRLSFPSKSIKNLPGFEGRNVVHLRVMDKRGSPWRFSCYIRKKGGFRKPVLSGDWHRFVVSKGLSIGDEVRLFKEIDQATGALLHYRVEVTKFNQMRLFGVSIEHAPTIVRM
ncbi:hypothetical protein L484_018433 [Morus notabilis]|uniref:TF-B3 domain-containing protein n=1 Tax=Morus notabilis TaxID=981085 RepID=W9QYE3_9ROSA|nr:hypothetical protein L484_018433 [Morus notabilis]